MLILEGSTHDCGLDQDALDLVDVHPPHHGLGYGGDGGHGSSLGLYSGNILGHQLYFPHRSIFQLQGSYARLQKGQNSLIYFLRSWCLMARKGMDRPLPKNIMK